MPKPKRPFRRSLFSKPLDEKRRDFQLNLRTSAMAKGIVAKLLKNRRGVPPQVVQMLESHVAMTLRYVMDYQKRLREPDMDRARTKAVQERLAMRTAALKKLLEKRGLKDVEVTPANSPDNWGGDFDDVSIRVEGKSRPDLNARYAPMIAGLERRFLHEFDARGGEREPTRKVVGLRDHTRRAMEQLISGFNEVRTLEGPFEKWLKEKWMPEQRDWFKRPEHRAYFMEWIQKNKNRLKRQMVATERGKFNALMKMVERMFE